eukprot:jgi/Botrbrau1/17233/Bobra.0640s0001.2
MSSVTSDRFKNLSEDDRSLLEGSLREGFEVTDLLEEDVDSMNPIAPTTEGSEGKRKKRPLSKEDIEQYVDALVQEKLEARQAEVKHRSKNRCKEVPPRGGHYQTSTPILVQLISQRKFKGHHPSGELLEDPLVHQGREESWTLGRRWEEENGLDPSDDESGTSSTNSRGPGTQGGPVPELFSEPLVEGEEEGIMEGEEEKPTSSSGSQSWRPGSSDATSSQRSPSSGVSSPGSQWTPAGGPARAESPSSLTPQERQVAQANRHRRAVIYKEGDLVLLRTKFPAALTSQKYIMLARRRIGPFRVTAVHPNSVELDVPAALKFHPRINVEYVDLYKGPRNPDRLSIYKYQPGPRMVKGDDGTENAEYVVDGILGHRPLMKGNRALHFPDGTPAYQYWVLWSGYDVGDDWDPLDMFDHAKDTINAYHRHQELGPPKWGETAV